jgi:hypothetical protein
MMLRCRDERAGETGVRVSGKAGLMIILGAAGLGFFFALAGSPGIGSIKKDEVVYFSLVDVNQQAEEPE